MDVIRLTHAALPSDHLRFNSGPFSEGVGLYSPSLADLDAAQPGWSTPGYDQSAWEALYSYASLPLPWGTPLFSPPGVEWQSDPYVQDHGFVTGKNWAGRWGFTWPADLTVLSASIGAECTDHLQVLRLNGVDALAGPPLGPRINVGGANVVASYLYSDVLDPYAALAWGLTIVYVETSFLHKVRLTVVPGQTVRLVHHS